MNMDGMMDTPIIDKDTCKGLFWRASVHSYLSKYNSIEVSKSLRLLKKRSCKGCDKCYWIWEYFQEDMTLAAGDYLEDIEHGKIYTFKCHSSTDFDTGVRELDEIEFVRG